MRAWVFDRAGLSHPSRYWCTRYCLPPPSKGIGVPELWVFAIQYPGPHFPLSTLRHRPRGQLRMTQGQCGSLGFSLCDSFIHCISSV
jgi:hypothetical protein